MTFTATVTPTLGGATPGGNVTFVIDGSAGPTISLAAGHATFTTASLSVGTHTVHVNYNGDANSAPSSSPTLNQGVGTTTTALTSSANPSSPGQAVTFAITVSGPGGAPTGAVLVRDGGAPLVTLPLVGGQAAFTTSGLGIGSHALTASYGGDSNFGGSTSATLAQEVVAPSGGGSSSTGGSSGGGGGGATATVASALPPPGCTLTAGARQKVAALRARRKRAEPAPLTANVTCSRSVSGTIATALVLTPRRRVRAHHARTRTVALGAVRFTVDGTTSTNVTIPLTRSQVAAVRGAAKATATLTLSGNAPDGAAASASATVTKVAAKR